MLERTLIPSRNTNKKSLAARSFAQTLAFPICESFRPDSSLLPRQYSLELARNSTRMSVLSILKKHEAGRQAAKIRISWEKAKAAQAWKEEERRARESRLQAFCSRMSKSKNAKNASTKKLSSVFPYRNPPPPPSRQQHSGAKTAVKSKRRRISPERAAQEASTLRNIRDMRKRLESELSQRMQHFTEKLERAKLAVTRIQFAKVQGLQYNSVMRNKKVLKARINNLLVTETGRVCEHYLKNEERVSQAEMKDREKKVSKSKTMCCSASAVTVGERPQPDEVLYSHLSNSELKQVGCGGIAGR